MSKNQNTGNFAGGVILIIIGLFFFLGEFQIMPHDLYQSLHRWPMILVAIGIYYLLQKKISTAVPLLIIGTLFLMPHWFRITFNNIWQYWPLMLIAIGLWIILKSRRKPTFTPPVPGTTNSDVFEITAILTGITRQVSSPNFKGGMVKILLGGSDIYLIDADPIPEGATIDLSILLGGTKIVVPTDWNVIVEVSAILGGVTDKRIRTSGNNQKTLRLTGHVMLGGIDIVNA